MENTGIILVRSNSKRLPKKCFLSFGKFTVLEHVIRRCIYYKINPIICTTVSKQDNRIVKLAKKLNILYCRGSEKNKILRISNCCKKFNIKYFHTIDADDPFFCGKAVKKSMKKLIRGNFDIIEPTISSSKGSGLVGYSVKSLIFHLLSKKINKNTNTEMMWGFFKKIRGLKIERLKELHPVVKARLTLDYYEDYIFLETLRLLLGNFASRLSIFRLLKKNPQISKINMFRSSQWSKSQKKKISQIK
jgi:spore coat polysaccharide biosynthesis protein SpsF (cytidylyltransferase family)